MKRLGLILLAVPLVSYGVYAGALFFLQRELIYPGRRIPVAATPEVTTPGLTRLWLETSAGRVEAWFLPPLTGRGRRPAVIFGHGNGEVIDQWQTGLDRFRELGLGVLLVEYPGYGRSAGAPTEASIRESFVEAYDRLCQLPEVDPSAIVAYGQSLGGGAVCALARKRGLKALILQSTFTSLRPFAIRHGLPPFLLRDTFDNLASVRAYRGPVLVIHGRSDEMIPMEQGVRLSRASARGSFREYDCGHWCWYPERLPFWSDVTDFLEKAGVLLVAAASPYPRRGGQRDVGSTEP